MRIPLSVRIRSFFSRDKNAFWFDHFTDEEKELARMDVWQLASVIQESGVRVGMEQKRIVAEHVLNQRIARIQSRASLWSGWLGMFGALAGAALGFFLSTSVPKETPQQICNCQWSNPVQGPVATPKPTAPASVVPRRKNVEIKPDSGKSQKAPANGNTKP